MTSEPTHPAIAQGIIDQIILYLEQAEIHSNGKSHTPPAFNSLCGIFLPNASIVSASPGGDRSGSFIAATIRHREVRTPRLFDPCFFASMRLMEFAGVRFRFYSNRLDGKLYLYLRCDPPKGKNGPYLARIIRGTRPDEETPFATDHHDYRHAALTCASSRHRAQSTHRGRDTIIELIKSSAAEDDQLSMHPHNMSELVAWSFDVADRAEANRAIAP